MLRVAALHENRKVSGSSIVLAILKLRMSVRCVLPSRGFGPSILFRCDHRLRTVVSRWNYRWRFVARPKSDGYPPNFSTSCFSAYRGS